MLHTHTKGKGKSEVYTNYLLYKEVFPFPYDFGV
jgi:hypothetical protein